MGSRSKWPVRSHERVPRKRSAGRAGEWRPWVAGASERRRAEARIGVGFPDALACGLFIFFFFFFGAKIAEHACELWG